MKETANFSHKKGTKTLARQDVVVRGTSKTPGPPKTGQTNEFIGQVDETLEFVFIPACFSGKRSVRRS
jgi:hypothetical protein